MKVLQIKISLLSFFYLITFLIIGINSNAQNCITCTTGVTTLNQGLVFCVPFDGADQTDKTASSFPGTLVNSPVAITDRKASSNGSFRFNGTSNYIKYGDILDSVFARNPQAQFSISIWGYTNVLSGISGDNVLIAKSSGGASGPYQWYIYHDADGKVAGLVSYAIAASTNYIEQKSQVPISTSGWFHVVLIYDGKQANNLNRLRIYVNNSPGTFSRSAGVGGTTTNNTTQELTVGGEYNPSNGSSVNIYDGRVDDIRIYNRVLSTSEISELYNGTPLPITPMPDVGLCIGDSVQLTSAGGSTYAWFPSTNLSATNIANPYCKPTQNRTYFVTVTSGSCTNKDTVVVNLNQNCCVLSSSISSKNSNQVYYVPVNNEARDVSSTPASTTVNGGGVGLNTDRFGNKNSSYSFTNVATDRILTAAVPKLTFAAGTSFSLSAWVYPRSVRTVASRILSVFKNGGYEIILTPSLPAVDAGKIEFQDYDGATSTTKVLIKSDSVISINAWSLITVTVDKSDNSNKLYINGRLAASIQAPNSTQTTCGVSIGNHNLNAQGFDGMIDEVRIYNTALTQNEILDLYYTGKSIILNADTTICSGDSVPLRIMGNSTSYSWSPTTGLSDPNIAEPIARPLVTTQYILTSSNGGCTFKDTVVINVNIAAANAGTDTTICPGDSVRLNGSGGASYLWSPSGVLSATNISNPYAKPASSMNFILTVSTASCTSVDTMRVNVNFVNADAGNDVDLCYGDSVQLHATGGTSYQWNPFNTLSYYADSTPYSKTLTSTTYHVTVTSGFCTNTDSVRVNVIKVLTDAGTQGQICPGDSIMLNASGASSYAWLRTPGINDTTISNPFVKPSSTSWFYVYGVIGQCKVIDSVQILVQSSLVTDAGMPQTICRGEAVSLNATGGSNFIWTPNKWINNTSISNPTSIPDSTIIYHVIGSSGNCTSEDSIEITVNQLPIVDLGNDTVACIGQPFPLTPIIINANDYQWTPTGSVDNPTAPFPNATVFAKTEFKVVATNLSTGCLNADSFWLDVSHPVAAFNLSSVSGDVPFKVQTSNQSTTQPMTYVWTFEDSTDFYSVESNPSYTYYHPGKYKIILQATDIYGCSAYDTSGVFVMDVLNFFIPNAFSPNGDHNNQFFKPVYSTDLVSKVEGTIYNRWGQLVYTFTVPGDNWWEGKSDNNFSPEGVYLYLMKVTDINNHVKTYKGQVTLLR